MQRRLALLETDNQRLAKVLGEKQRAEAAAADQARRSEIERTVSKLRDLAFLHPVTYREIPRADLPAILRQKLAQQVPDQEFGKTSVSLAALGLLPDGLDLKKTYLDLLGEQIGAFYDQHSAELFTFSGQPLDNGQNRVISGARADSCPGGSALSVGAVAAGGQRQRRPRSGGERTRGGRCHAGDESVHAR